MRKKWLICFMCMVLWTVLLAGCSSASKETSEVGNSAVSETAAGEEKPATDLYVFIAASLSNVMDEVKTMYEEKNPNVNLVYNADSSGTLQTQIEEGAECDLFFSAATKQMNALTEESYVEDGTVKNLLENQVVLIKAKGEATKVTGFEDITNASSLALAGEDVPAGQYAREIFTSIGNINDVLSMEINEGANVTAVLTAVAEKSNEVGVVYATDAASMPDDVEIIAAAPEGSMKSPAIYPVGQIVNEQASQEEKEAAEDFENYLTTDEVLSVFTNYGFTIYSE